jgi:hypothetical protein
MSSLAVLDVDNIEPPTKSCFDDDYAQQDEFERLTDLFNDESKGQPFIDFYTPLVQTCSGITTSPLPPYAAETPQTSLILGTGSYDSGDEIIIANHIAHHKIRSVRQLERLQMRHVTPLNTGRSMECL